MRAVLGGPHVNLACKNLILSFALLLLLCLSTMSHAASHYVGPSNCGDDTNHGSTAAAPWCTIDFGIAHISGGDTLYIRGGSYQPNGGAGYIIISGPAGTSSQHTVIRNYSGETPIITGSSGGSGFRLQGTSYIDLIGLELSGTSEGLSLEGASHILGDTLNIHDMKAACVHLRKCTSGACVGVVSSFNTIQNSTIHNCGLDTTSNGDGFYIGTSGDSTDTTNNITIYNNNITHTGTECVNIKDFTNHTTVDHNTCNTNVTSNNQYSDAAIMLKSSTTTNKANDIIRNNIISNFGPGSNCGSTPSCDASNSAIRIQHSATVYNNIIYGPNLTSLGHAFRTENSDTRLIYHNTVDAATARVINVASGAAPTIANNIGPDPATYPNNLAINSAYFANYASHDYHLMAGSAPINAGLDLTAIISTDIDGDSRMPPPPDMGAYEYVGNTSVAPPTGLSAVVR